MDDQNRVHKAGRGFTTYIIEALRDFGLACTENRSRMKSVHRDNIKTDVKDIRCTVTSWILKWDVHQRYFLVNKLFNICDSQKRKQFIVCWCKPGGSLCSHLFMFRKRRFQMKSCSKNSLPGPHNGRTSCYSKMFSPVNL